MTYNIYTTLYISSLTRSPDLGHEGPDEVHALAAHTRDREHGGNCIYTYMYIMFILIGECIYTCLKQRKRIRI